MRSNERGETIVEVVMALGILSLVLVSSYALATGTFRLGRGAGERTQAVNYLQEQAEALRVYRNSVDWDTEFRSTMSRYNPALAKTFCMKQQTPTATNPQTWVPTEVDCKQGNIELKITAEPVTIKGNVDQFNYQLSATWKTGGKDSNVRLTTKLVKQGTQ